MNTTTRANGFPTLTMSGSNKNKNKNNAQNLNTFGSTAWPSNVNLWGTIGTGSFNTNRETAGSRGSDELSPTAASGSAQLNLLSEPAPWSNRGIWNPVNTSPSNVSPPRPKDSRSFDFNSNSNTSSMTTVRHVGQPLGRTVPPGPVESPASPMSFDADAAARVNGYGPPPYHSHNLNAPGPFRRNSENPSVAGFGPRRVGTFSGIQPETSVPTHGNHFGENRARDFANNLQGRQQARPQQRASISNTPLSGLTDDSAHVNLSAFSQTLAFEETAEPVNGHGGNGYTNLASQPFQLNPSSESWPDGTNNGTRTYSHGTHHERWAEPPQASFNIVENGSIELSSPTANRHRGFGNSPRTFPGTPSARPDPWNGQGKRNPIMSHDLDRQQQGSQYHQLAYPPQPYFNSNGPPFSTPYHPYPNYPMHVSATSYGMPIGYMNGAVRSNQNRDPSQGARSMLLEEFLRTSKPDRRFELKDVYNHIVEFSGDQHGSRFIQAKLVGANSEEKEHVFREIEPNALQLMKDVFGNYVIQRFFEHGNQVQKRIIAAQMKGKVAELSLQMYSCRVVQKALEHVLVEQQQEIIEELKPDVMRIVKDQNGNHVIQKVIETLPRLCIPFMMDAFRGEFNSLAKHNYACRVIQRMLERGTEAERQTIMADLRVCTAQLMTDQYGNYVIQHIISQGEPEDRSVMIQHVLDRLLFLSKHKYASNVVEKCIQFGSDDVRSAIRIKVTSPNSDGTSPLPLMMKDQFGNYVIQKLHGYLQGAEQESFEEEMKPYIAALRKPGTNTQRQVGALERNISEAVAARAKAATGRAPSTPPLESLVVEVSSSVVTPQLTTAESSPQSSSPPSTNNSTTDEVAEQTANASQLTKSSSPVYHEDN